MMRSGIGARMSSEPAEQASTVPVTTWHDTGTAQILLHASAWCVFWAVCTMLIVRLRWDWGGTSLAWSATGGAAMATAYVYASMRLRAMPSKSIRACLALIVMLVAAGIILGGASHDFSSDGQSYQQQAILAMMEGWNPIGQHHYTGPFSIWISHYALGPWMLAAAVGTDLGLEYGKGIAWLFALSSACLSFCVIRYRLGLGIWPSLTGSALLMFNPVFSSQIQTFYVDGLLNALLTQAVITAWILAIHPSRFLTLSLAACVVIAINLKFTAGPFVIVIAGTLVCVALWRRQRDAARCLLTAIAIGAIAGLWMGNSPYVNNMNDHGNPFYPLAGKGKQDILTDFAGKEFLKQDRFIKFARSVTSVSNHDTPSQQAPAGATVFKFPGMIRLAELKAFYATTGMRIGGFGPWMSLILGLGLSYCACVAVRTPVLPSTPDNFWIDAGAMGSLFFSAIIMPDFWWARYAPQLWTGVILCLLLAYALPQSVPLSRFGKGVLAIALFNSLLVLALTVTNRLISELDYSEQIRSLRRISMKSPLLIKIELDSTRFKLRQSKVAFVEGETATCPLVDHLRGTDSIICIPAASSALYRPGSDLVAKILRRSNRLNSTSASAAQ